MLVVVGEGGWVGGWVGGGERGGTRWEAGGVGGGVRVQWVLSEVVRWMNGGGAKGRDKRTSVDIIETNNRLNHYSS